MTTHLRENELIIFEEKTTDLYHKDKLFGITMLSKSRCKFAITNQRVLFKYFWSKEIFEIEISSIKKIEKCFIGFPIVGTDKMIPFFPIGIDIFIKNEETEEKHMIFLVIKYKRILNKKKTIKRF